MRTHVPPQSEFDDPLAVSDRGLEEGWKHHPRQYVYFAVSDLDATYERAMDAGCTVVDGGVQRMSWGERMFWAKDPFGNPISFVDEKTLFTGVKV
jgi:uncharacterized glyoxalase superfamily protein PhnB